MPRFRQCIYKARRSQQFDHFKSSPSRTEVGGQESTTFKLVIYIGSCIDNHERCRTLPRLATGFLCAGSMDCTVGNIGNGSKKISLADISDALTIQFADICHQRRALEGLRGVSEGYHESEPVELRNSECMAGLVRGAVAPPPLQLDSLDKRQSSSQSSNWHSKSPGLRIRHAAENRGADYC